ncbi:MAG: hypothetical protein ACM3MD_10005 [Betaproteobacteria bacterium]
MLISTKRRVAQQFYHTGFSLFQENRYEQALIELRRAGEAFRKMDARGHPFNHILPNGVTGLANSLALSGHCHQRLGNTQKAIASFEASYINARFERPKPFQTFVAGVREDLIACYAHGLDKFDQQTMLRTMVRDIQIDTTHRFPFSLTREAVPLARLYELAPERFPQFKDFFIRAKEKDAALRLSDKRSDESRMKKAGISLWVILGSLWAAYSLFMARAIFLK